MNWTQPICLTCWLGKNHERGPRCVVDADPETCCMCGAMTQDGIYFRVDPRTVPHPTNGDQVDG